MVLSPYKARTIGTWGLCPSNPVQTDSIPQSTPSIYLLFLIADTEHEWYFLFTDSFLKCLGSRGRTKVGPGWSRESETLGVPNGWQGPNSLSLLLIPPCTGICRRLDWDPNEDLIAGILTRGTSVLHGGLTHCTTLLVFGPWFLIRLGFCPPSTINVRPWGQGFYHLGVGGRPKSCPVVAEG